MVAGRVVRFDTTRGYGFIAPDGGGEDVFLHVNDLQIPEALIRSGLAVEFETENGGRGLKASSVRLAGGSSLPQSVIQQVVTGPPAVLGNATEDSPMCDVLSAEEYRGELTELMLKAVPSLTGQQILQLRDELVEFGRGRGWIEE